MSRFLSFAETIFTQTVIMDIQIRSWSSFHQTNGSMQERRNSIADALELRLSCINQSS